MINLISMYASSKERSNLIECLKSISATYDRRFYIHVLFKGKDNEINLDDVVDVLKTSKPSLMGVDLDLVDKSKLDSLNYAARKAYELSTFYGSRNINLIWLGNLVKFKDVSWVGRLEDALKLDGVDAASSGTIQVGSRQVTSGSLYGMGMRFFMHISFTRNGRLFHDAYRTWTFSCAEADLFVRKSGYQTMQIEAVDQLLCRLDEDDPLDIRLDREEFARDKDYVNFYNSVS